MTGRVLFGQNYRTEEIARTCKEGENRYPALRVRWLNLRPVLPGLHRDI